jgi:hypothetical protein
MVTSRTGRAKIKPVSANLELPNLNISSEQRPISRRELAQKLLGGVAFGFSAVHPIRKHLLNAALLDSADAHLAANGQPLFLSAAQLTTLDVLAEAVVSGSRQTQSAQFIDLLLSCDTHQIQEEFLASFAALETASQQAFHTGIAALDPEQLQRLLTTVSAPAFVDYKHFNNLKEWITGAYYSSEIGMRELGWTPDRVFSAFPACPHPEGHS